MVIVLIAVVGFNGLGDSNARGANDNARDTGFGICDGDGAFNPGLTPPSSECSGRCRGTTDPGLVETC